MSLGPWLVTRGLVIGNLLVILLTSIFSANASPAAAQVADSPAPANQAMPASHTSLSDSETVAQPQAQTADAVACAVSPAFPEAVYQWCGIITRYANQHGLEPDLVAAVILQESAGDSEAISRSGAIGLMQVMPRDGLAASFMCINGPCFANRPPSAELYDAEFNLEYGTRMLAKLLERHGDMREALRAYGPMDRGYSYADKVLSLYQRYRQ